MHHCSLLRTASPFKVIVCRLRHSARGSTKLMLHSFSLFLANRIACSACFSLAACIPMQGNKRYLVRVFFEKTTICIRCFFDPIDRTTIEQLSKKYRTTIEQMRSQVIMSYTEKTLHFRNIITCALDMAAAWESGGRSQDEVYWLLKKQVWFYSIFYTINYYGSA
jgi:hypothetical protein